METRAHGLVLDGAEELNRTSIEPVRVLFICSGIGIMNRGIESFFQEAFHGLRNLEGLEALLLKGGGEPTVDELLTWNLPRTGGLARLLANSTI